MTGYTPVKRFRYPQRGEIGTDVDIANLASDFDIEVQNQIDTKVKRVTRTPLGSMWRYSNNLAFAGGWTKMTWEGSTGDFGGLPGDRFVVPSVVGPGLFMVQCMVRVGGVPSNCTSIGLKTEIGGSTTAVMERKVRRECQRLGSAYVIGLPAVGDWVQWSVGFYTSGTGAYTDWADCYIWKVGDLT